MTTDLAEWLLAQIAEDESDQRDVDAQWHRSDCAWDVDHPCDCGTPARVLAECAAKRRVLARHRRWGDLPEDHHEGWARGMWPDACVGCGLTGDPDYPVTWSIYGGSSFDPCPELADMASVYADRPGYDPAWGVQ